MNLVKIFCAALAGLGFGGPVAAAIVVDGNINDWLAPGGKATWTVASADIFATVEDQKGTGAFYLNPGHGGQAYDAEALFATIRGGKLFIALATGHNPWTLNNPGANSYGAGDFALDFGKNGSYDAAININFAKSFSNNAYVFESSFIEGGVYKNVSWDYGLWRGPNQLARNAAERDPAHPTSMLGGTKVGNSTLAYTKNDRRSGGGDGGLTGYGSAPGDKHYFYEISVDLAVLRLAGWAGDPFNIHWTENCANDSIIVDPDNPVSEPPALALFSVGLLGLAGLRRRRKS